MLLCWKTSVFKFINASYMLTSEHFWKLKKIVIDIVYSNPMEFVGCTVESVNLSIYVTVNMYKDR